MSDTMHVSHIASHKKNLELRHEILKYIREFFWSKSFQEVETPNIVRVPGQEPYLDPVHVTINNEQGARFRGYLHTSPEYTMKKMVAAGFGDIFSLSKCYRNKESFGGLHNPEFTMLEWYRVAAGFDKVMEDVENLYTFLMQKLEIDPISFRRVHMRDLWSEHVGVNLDEYLNVESMRHLCQERGYDPEDNESYEDLFYRMFLNEIEPKLAQSTIVHHYPATMAALAKLSGDDPRYAERFEVYIGGMEIANAFTELTDKDEQLRRLQEERELRKSLGKDIYDIDMEFVDAVGNLPDCAGIALGVDRLVMVLLGVENIDDILTMPMSRLF